ncbi:MAG: type II 3-dehydroquinate dehydratase [Tannerellaceae bacterium]|jgi:3-dehydroquinate dehydratase-2|nr:type II 3-dehydroquinate dehydratase [Tannerellaceae bacterium]
MKKQRIVIVNGPNLNLLGKREPEIYGEKTFEQYVEELRLLFPQLEIETFQSNSEGALVDKIQEAGFESDGIVLNAGAYTHTSLALHDAIKAVPAPVIEVHISNVHAREKFRQHSYLTAVCRGVIAGFGFDSYRLALHNFAGLTGE